MQYVVLLMDSIEKSQAPTNLEPSVAENLVMPSPMPSKEDVSKAYKTHTLERSQARPPRPVLLPDSDYEATLKCWRTNSIPGEKSNGTEKLELHWQIIRDGETIVIRQFFNIGKTRRGINVGWSSKLMRNYAALYGYSKNQYVDPDDFARRVIRLTTTTVKSGRGDKKLKGMARYSIVESLNELVAGKNPNE